MALISVAHKSNRLHKAYVLHSLSALWREAGHEVRIGQRFVPDADAGILHVDLTRIDPLHIPARPLKGPVLNQQVLDISKRRISSLLLTPDSDWQGEVIIKTDLNHFGAPERTGRPLSWRARMQSKAAELSWRYARQLPHKTYPVLPHLRRVPGWVWRDPALVVERFMPEREGEYYCLRGWMFLGSKGYGYRLFSTDPLVKTGTMVKYEYIDEPPAALHDFRAAHGYDFGKFDYVMHEGAPILLDANKTPGFSGDPLSPRIRHLADGIRDFL
jgi:hypothetical protein